MPPTLRGVFSAVATPLTPDGSVVDVAALAANVEWALSAGIDGFVPCGSTGEFAFLSRAERALVVETVVAQVAGRVPVLAQIGAMSTAEAIAHARHAQAAGADGLMAVAPYYEPLTVPEVMDFYRAIGSATELPIMAYNLPVATGVRLGLDEMTALVEQIPTLRYVKDTSGDFALAAQLIHNLGDQVSVFVGWDPLFCAALLEGAAGSVIGAANVVPAELCAVFDAVDSGELSRARELWGQMYPVLEQIVSAPYNSSIKAGMDLVGHPGGPLRAPQQPLAPPARTALAGRLEVLAARARAASYA